MSADEILEYIDRFNSGDDLTVIKGAFLTVVGREAFTLLKPVGLPPNIEGRRKTMTHFALSTQNCIYYFR